MVYYSWFVVMLLLLASCGRPLQGLPTPVETRASQSTFASAESALPAELSTPSGATAAVPTVISATVPLLVTDVATAAATPMLTATLALVTATPVLTPTISNITPIVIVPYTATAQSNEQRWRTQQADRQVLTPPQTFVAAAPVDALWFDPVTGQSLIVGRLVGVFPVQATFRVLPANARALEVPYRIGRDFGLTALSPVLVERMRAAGYTEYAEVYILETDVITQK